MSKLQWSRRIPRAFGVVAICGWIGIVGCQSQVQSPSPAGSSTAEAEDAMTTEAMRGDVAEAQLELAAAKEDLTRIVKSAGKFDDGALDAILERLEQAESKLDGILHRAESLEGTGGQ